MDKGKLAVLGTVAAALSAPLPAVAQNIAAPYAVSSAAVSKSEALLGAPSKLASLLAQQSGGASAPYQAAAALQPAVLRSPWSDRPIALTRAAIAPGSPDVFGSVALAVSATPLDRRWQAVARRPADPVLSRWAATLADRSEAERIDTVNRMVNARIAFVDDSVQFGRPDVWQSAAESLRRGRGDCEDYAIAKLQLLRAAGFAASDLYLVIAKDLVRRSDHAVLAVASGGRLWVLDNGTNRVSDSADVADYRPIFTYAGGKSWTHGYRRSAEPPMVLASTQPTERNLPTPASAPNVASLPSADPTFTISLADFAPGLTG